MGGSLSRKSEAGRQKEVGQEGLRVSQKQTSCCIFFQGPALCHAETIWKAMLFPQMLNQLMNWGETQNFFNVIY